jgi:uncharacterized protein with ATP-grasp and redox domains
MKIQSECIPCQVRQAREAIASSGVDRDQALGVLRDVMRLITELDWNVASPVLAQQVHRKVRQLTHNSDPYAAVKERLTRLAVQLYPVWNRRFREAHPPLEAAVRLAIVGNLLDAGPKLRLDDEAVTSVFHEALTAPVLGNIELLRDAIAGVRSVLYLADNAGEIIFDRDLLALLPKADCTVAVRGYPVLNDATLAEAEQAGLPGFCKIISNGSDAPGTLLEDCSPEFRACFDAADLIIAKGQGNYESLMDTHDSRIFFLLKVKCPVLAKPMGCPCGSLLLRNAASTSDTPSR